MTVVTLTGDLGSMGRIARLTAQRLDYDLLEPELTIAAAQALSFPERRIEALGKRTGGLGSRFVELLREYNRRTRSVAGRSLFAGGAVEEVMSRTYAETAGSRMTNDDRQYIEALRGVVQFFAKRGNFVMVGRGTQMILAGARDTVHIRVFCPLEERVQRVAKLNHRTPDDVRRRVEDSDRERAAWHRKYFGSDYQALEHYDAVLNADRIKDETASELVIEVSGRLAGRARARA